MKGYAVTFRSRMILVVGLLFTVSAFAGNEDAAMTRAAKALRAAVGSRQVSCLNRTKYGLPPVTNISAVGNVVQVVYVKTGDVEGNILADVKRGVIRLELGDDAPHTIVNIPLTGLKNAAQGRIESAPASYYFNDERPSTAEPLQCVVK